jgi:hypothetical protein
MTTAQDGGKVEDTQNNNGMTQYTEQRENKEEKQQRLCFTGHVLK